MPTIPKMYVGDLAPSTLPFGLFSVASPTNADPHALSGVEWETESCDPTYGIAGGPCETVGQIEAKDITNPGSSLVSADPISIYTLRSCRAVGDLARAKDRAVAHLVGVEERAIETHLWGLMNADADAVNLTPSGPLEPLAGLALLEQSMAQGTTGGITIHARRDAATVLAEKARVRRHGNRLETELGSLVSAGVGYGSTGPDADASGEPDAAPAGTAWVYATGALRIWRSVAEVRGPFMQESPRDNTHMTLAEKTYVVGYECAPRAVLINLGTSSTI